MPDLAKKVAILGIGGLGHMAIKIAKAMGAHVTVFTTSPSKVEDAKRLGADEAVLSSDANQMAKYNRQLHFIIDTVSAKHDVNVYLNLLRHDGSVFLVGLPPEPLEIGVFNVVMGRRSFAGSNIGGIAETQEMLDDWVARIAQWRGEGLQKLYFFVHQNTELGSPLLAEHFIKKLNASLDLSLPIPAKQTAQRSMFDGLNLGL